MMWRLLLALLCLMPAPALAQSERLRVMSFNVRLPIDKQPERAWEARLPVAVAAIRRERPDVIGTQELWKRQGDDLIAALPDYAWFGIDRRGGHADEHMGVLYNRRSLTLVEFGNFWLSDAPDVPGSITWGHPFPRMVTWAVFETRAKRCFLFANTHLPYRAEDEAARVKGVEAIVRWLAARPAGRDLPVVLTGDFNTTPDSAAYRILSASLTDAHGAAAKREGPDATFHDFTGTAGRRIDWIFANGLTTKRFATLTDRRGPVQASDHFPVVADFAWPR